MPKKRKGKYPEQILKPQHVRSTVSLLESTSKLHLYHRGNKMATNERRMEVLNALKK